MNDHQYSHDSDSSSSRLLLEGLDAALELLGLLFELFCGLF